MPHKRPSSPLHCSRPIAKTSTGVLVKLARPSDSLASNKTAALKRASCWRVSNAANPRSEEHTSELQSHLNLVCRLLLEKKKDVQAPTHLRVAQPLTTAPLLAT